MKGKEVYGRFSMMLGVVGLVLLGLGVALSFGAFLHFTMIFTFGLLLFVISLNKEFFDEMRDGKFLFFLVIVGVAVALVIEFVGRKIAPAWFYVFDPAGLFGLSLSFWFEIIPYVFCMPVAFGIYSFFRNVFVHRKSVGMKCGVGSFDGILLVLSLALMSVPFWFESSYEGLPFCFFIVGFFLFSDALVSRVGRESVLRRLGLREGVALVLTSFVLGFSIELLNLSQHVWTYVNVPFLDVVFFGVPFIILVGWVPLVGVWVNFYEVIGFLRKKVD